MVKQLVCQLVGQPIKQNLFVFGRVGRCGKGESVGQGESGDDSLRKNAQMLW